MQTCKEVHMGHELLEHALTSSVESSTSLRFAALIALKLLGAGARSSSDSK